MKYAVLAAGEGSRLSHEGIAVPKPLVVLNGMTLLERLVRLFCNEGATQVCVSANERMPGLLSHLDSLQRQGLPLRYVACTPPSSMHSFCELSRWLSDEPFVMTTVDTVFRPQEFARYVDTFKRLLANGEADALMGITTYIDDEKPLYVRVGQGAQEGQVAAFLDEDPQPRYVSAGIYGLTPRCLDTLHACVARGESRMRNFQRALLTDGLRLRAYEFSKVIDVDHASDVVKAEKLLSE